MPDACTGRHAVMYLGKDSSGQDAYLSFGGPGSSPPKRKTHYPVERRGSEDVTAANGYSCRTYPAFFAETGGWAGLLYSEVVAATSSNRMPSLQCSAWPSSLQFSPIHADRVPEKAQGHKLMVPVVTLQVQMACARRGWSSHSQSSRTAAHVALITIRASKSNAQLGAPTVAGTTCCSSTPPRAHALSCKLLAPTACLQVRLRRMP